MSSRKKSSQKKGALTRAKERRKKERERLKYILKILSVILLLSSVILAFGFFTSKDKNSSDDNISSKHLEKNISVKTEVPEEYPKDEDEHFNLLSILTNWGKKTKSTRCIIKKSNSPRLVIIIDDVSNIRQIKAIENIPYHLTPSIFPPSELSMHSNTLARGRKHFMVHLPMQSGSKQFNKMYKTLFVTDSKKKMEKRIKEIRRLFPNDIFINNHTGSVFTSNYQAMKSLYGYMRKEGFIFVDSRTTAKSKVKKIVAEYKDLYIARDIFLDNKQNVPYILSQLKRAVKIAKHRGYAIAIGHPHRATLRALHQAKSILKDVQVVYIDELVKRISSD